MAVQKITTPKGEVLVIMPISDYQQMIDAAGDRGDRGAVVTFWAKLAAGEEELVPDAMAKRLICGENPVKLWREYRGLTIRDLSDKVEISASYLSQIETGKREGAVSTYKKLAKALNIAIDDLVAAA